MNTLEYSDEEGKVLTAALTDWHKHLSMAIQRIPADAQFIPPPDRAIQVVEGITAGLLTKLGVVIPPVEPATAKNLPVPTPIIREAEPETVALRTEGAVSRPKVLSKRDLQSI